MKNADFMGFGTIKEIILGLIKFQTATTKTLGNPMFLRVFSFCPDI